MRQVRLGDTICACASTLPSPIAVIRVSGPQTLAALQQFFSLENLPLPRTLKTVRLDLGFFADEVMFWVCPAPKTMTGEDYAEIMLHGSTEVVSSVLELLTRLGLKSAQPGEFSYRAYVNGKTSLMQALSVAGVIASQSKTDLSLLTQLKNNVADQYLLSLKNNAIALYNALQVVLDYSEQGYEPVELEQSIHQQIQGFEQTLHELERVLNPLIQEVSKQLVVIVGPSNSGKSTLFNKLLGYDRVLSSPIPGTTRDYVSAQLQYLDRRFELVDTAGIRDTADAVELLGIESTFQVIKRATALIWVLPLNGVEPDKEYCVLEYCPVNTPVIILGNKLDLATQSDVTRFSHWLSTICHMRPGISGCSISLIHESNRHVMNSLRGLWDQLPSQSATSCLLPENVRLTCQELIQEGRGCADHFIKGEYDLGQVKLERLLPTLSLLTGEITKTEIYQRLFSSFCLGK